MEKHQGEENTKLIKIEAYKVLYVWLLKNVKYIIENYAKSSQKYQEMICSRFSLSSLFCTVIVKHWIYYEISIECVTYLGILIEKGSLWILIGKRWHYDIKSVFFCLFSGESGSGKTEACKHIVRHLTARSSPKGFALEPRMKHVSLFSHQVGVTLKFTLPRNLYSLGLAIWTFCCSPFFLSFFFSLKKRQETSVLFFIHFSFHSLHSQSP